MAVRHFYATGLGGKLEAVKRPDVVITNAGSKCYGATWADTDTIINSSFWQQGRGINHLACTMQRLLSDPHVMTSWLKLLAAENIEWSVDVQRADQRSYDWPCPAHLHPPATDAVAGFAIILGSLSRTGPDLPPAVQAGMQAAPARQMAPVIMHFAGFSAGTAIWAELLHPWLREGGFVLPGVEIAQIRLGGIAATPEAVHSLLRSEQVRMVHVEQDELCRVDCERLLQAKDMCAPSCNVTFFSAQDKHNIARHLGSGYHSYEHLLDLPQLPVDDPARRSADWPLMDYHDTAKAMPLTSRPAQLGALLAFLVYTIGQDGLAQQAMDMVQEERPLEAKQRALIALVLGPAQGLPGRTIDRQATVAALADSANTVLCSFDLQWRTYLFDVILPGVFADASLTALVQVQTSCLPQVVEDHPDAPNHHRPRSDRFVEVKLALHQRFAHALIEISATFGKIRWAVWDGHTGRRGGQAAEGITQGDVLHMKLANASHTDVFYGHYADLEVSMLVTDVSNHTVRNPQAKGPKHIADRTMPHIVCGLVISASSTTHPVNATTPQLTALMNAMRGGFTFQKQSSATAPAFFERMASLSPWHLALLANTEETLHAPHTVDAQGTIFLDFMYTYQDMRNARAAHRIQQAAQASGAAPTLTNPRPVAVGSELDGAETPPEPLLWCETLRHKGADAWMALYSAAAHFADSLAEVMDDPRRIFDTLLIRMLIEYKQGGKVGYMQGMPGSGKTFLLMYMVILMAHLKVGRILWVAKDNAPLQSAAKYIDQLLMGAEPSLKARFARTLSSLELVKASQIDILHKERQDKDIFHGDIMVILATAGTLAVDARRYWPQFKHFHGACFMVYDEAQGFGKYEDGLALMMCGDDCILMMIGDPLQPVGAAPTATLKAILDAIKRRRLALRHRSLTHARVAEVRTAIRDRLQLLGMLKEADDDLLAAVLHGNFTRHDDLAGCAIGTLESDCPLLPWTALDYSFRLHPFMYLLLLHLAYAHLLPAQLRTVEDCLGFIPDRVHELVDNGERSVATGLPTAPTLDIPFLIDTSELQPFAPFKLQVWPFLVAALASIAARLGDCTTASRPIGVLICFKIPMDAFEAKLVTAEKDKTTDIRSTLEEMVVSERQQGHGKPTMQEYAEHLFARPHMWRPFLGVSTAMNGAGSDYSGVLYYIPDFNPLVDDCAAAIVGLSRAKQMYAVIAPLKRLIPGTLNSLALAASAGWGASAGCLPRLPDMTAIARMEHYTAWFQAAFRRVAMQQTAQGMRGDSRTMAKLVAHRFLPANALDWELLPLVLRRETATSVGSRALSLDMFLLPISIPAGAVPLALPVAAARGQEDEVDIDVYTATYMPPSKSCRVLVHWHRLHGFLAAEHFDQHGWCDRVFRDQAGFIIKSHKKQYTIRPLHQHPKPKYPK